MTKRHISQLFHGGGRVRSREAHREREMLFHLGAGSHCTNFQVRLFNFVITFHGECQDSVLRTPLLFIVYVGQGRHPMKKLCFFWALPKLSPLRAVCKGSIFYVFSQRNLSISQIFFQLDNHGLPGQIFFVAVNFLDFIKKGEKFRALGKN